MTFRLSLSDMAQIKALRGIHYNLDRVDLDDVSTPPYDVISAAEQARYLERSPYNFIRLDLGETYNSDTEGENRYTRAAATFTDWLREGILVRDDTPALYVYRQTYAEPPNHGAPGSTALSRTVTGLICLVKLEELGGGIMPHEKTLSGPKKDRRLLMDACETNFSQIFSLYADKSGRVKRILETATTGHPTQETRDEYGVLHQTWTLRDGQAIEEISRTLDPLPLLIADGHHRYETALNYAKEMRAAGIERDNLDYTMMYLVDMTSENLTILPTHRLVKLDDFDMAGFLSGIGRTFHVAGVMELGEFARSGDDPATVTFGLYFGGQAFKLTGNRRDLIDAMKSDHGPQWKSLDTAILQEAIVSPYLGIDSGSARLSFTQDIKEAKRAVDEGRATAAFLLRPTPIEQIQAVAVAGEKMPQKSTYFYPKPRTGLIVNKLD